MKKYLFFFILCVALSGNRSRMIFAEGADKVQLFPGAAAGLSNPYLFSISTGLNMTLRPQAPNAFPTVPSIRVDLEAGLGGGGLGMGVQLPLANGNSALNIKYTRIRTWLISLFVPRGEIYEGLILEYFMYGHVPAKLGVGYLTNIDDRVQEDKHMLYLFLGSGF